MCQWLKSAAIDIALKGRLLGEETKR